MNRNTFFGQGSVALWKERIVGGWIRYSRAFFFLLFFFVCGWGVFFWHYSWYDFRWSAEQQSQYRESQAHRTDFNRKAFEGVMRRLDHRGGEHTLVTTPLANIFSARGSGESSN